MDVTPYHPHQAFTEQLPCARCCAQLGGKGVSTEECPRWQVRQAHTEIIPNEAEHAIKGETMVTAILRLHMSRHLLWARGSA